MSEKLPEGATKAEASGLQRAVTALSTVHFPVTSGATNHLPQLQRKVMDVKEETAASLPGAPPPLPPLELPRREPIYGPVLRARLVRRWNEVRKPVNTWFMSRDERVHCADPAAALLAVGALTAGLFAPARIAVCRCCLQAAGRRTEPKRPVTVAA